ncbi:MxaD family protein [Actinosynnema sp. ALI-1.44]|uniref:SRPBCC family protein n=1 Tax=Actinosynnema sp. ALI-1.44 TaxID=1933779 RepID=UPI00097CAD31|nr:SRPBCC family protein [Actinosynnema sp. ALI-1.44]ONI90117.1 MxaD family protein [Actinosynnema sp. ALI-1.44]
MVWFRSTPIADESVFTTASHVYSYTMHLKADPDEVWAGLTADRPLAWCRPISVHYTSPRPFGVGTTREVRSMGVALRERFFIWDEQQRRHAFTVEQANVPGLGTLAEDYQVDPAEGGARFLWRFALNGAPRLSAGMKVLAPVQRKVVFNRLIRDTEQHFGTLRATEAA